VTRAAWQGIVRQLADACEVDGLDIVHPFNLSGCDFENLSRGVPCELSRRRGGLGVLVGNTRRLWPMFARARHEDATLAQAEHPLDTYVTTRLSAALLRCAAKTEVIWGHVTRPVAFPIQRLAEQVGLASLSPSHLAIHPTYGPWFALRAVILVDVDGPPSTPPLLERPCAGCSAPCVPALEHALRVSGAPLDGRAVAAHAREWIAVRDACPIGRASRYDEAQLSYHYVPASRKPGQGS
jgi:cyanocobalamin reductase (cyanide-eliminating) / alkylcobalamin dealkylase